MQWQLTNDALKEGTDTVSYDVLGAVAIVIAPGGKLMTMEDSHMSNASAHSIGVAFKEAARNIWKGFDRIANRSSIVETFML